MAQEVKKNGSYVIIDGTRAYPITDVHLAVQGEMVLAVNSSGDGFEWITP